MTNNQLTDERVTSVIERLEHYACNLKWTNVRGAQDLLAAADGLRELQERRKAAMDSEPVAWTWQHLKQWHVTNDEERARDLAWDGVKVEPLYRHAQPASDGYVMVPMRLTAENGAKGALSGEFSETKFVNCPECFGDDECETCDGSGRIEITVPVTWTTIKEIWAKGVEHFSATAQENN
ncbi:hypothetical protein A8C30_20650 [Klebsiella pneumoniae]|nr:hypothetical protein [Klebsiella pneumoniae]EIW9135553.1 hypothetical protein [Klebsiella pneumoniae]